MRYKIENEVIIVEIDSFGAELKSIRRKSDNREYLWNADPKFWKRSSPVLFPCVGSMTGKSYEYAGTTYDMPQHGFARDNEFNLVSQEDNAICFEFSASDETKKCYPFDFKLVIGYEVSGASVKVIWKVTNNGSEAMYFHIGAHPAFNCPINGESNKVGYGMRLNNVGDKAIYTRIDDSACMIDTEHELSLKDGVAEFTSGFFDEGVYIIADQKVTELSLVDAEGKDYVKVCFDAPLFGVWSPEGVDAPFVCLEPWWGRCDRASYTGDLAGREYNQVAKVGEEKEYAYVIEV